MERINSLHASNWSFCSRFPIRAENISENPQPLCDI
jgi:hypothetical protein